MTLTPHLGLLGCPDKHQKRSAWCVSDKQGIWCRTCDGKRPDENDHGVFTACGDWIILPHGIANREPTCLRCLARDVGRAR